MTTVVRLSSAPRGPRRVFITEGLAREGTPLGKKLVRRDGLLIREGDSPIGRILGRIDGPFLRRGASAKGEIVARVCTDGERIRLGDSLKGETVARCIGGSREDLLLGAAAILLL